MKGKGQFKLGNPPTESLGGDFYAGGKSKVASEAKNKAEGFKRGGKTMKAEGEMAKMYAGRKPSKSGGGVM